MDKEKKAEFKQRLHELRRKREKKNLIRPDSRYDESSEKSRRNKWMK